MFSDFLLGLRPSGKSDYPMDNFSRQPFGLSTVCTRLRSCLSGGLRSKRSIPRNFHPKVVVPLPARLEQVQKAESSSSSPGPNRNYPVMSRPPLVERTAHVWVGAGLAGLGTRETASKAVRFGPRGLRAVSETMPGGLNFSLVQCVSCIAVVLLQYCSVVMSVGVFFFQRKCLLTSPRRQTSYAKQPGLHVSERLTFGVTLELFHKNALNLVNHLQNHNHKLFMDKTTRM